MIIAHLGGSPQQHGPQGACSTDRRPFVSRREPLATDSQLTAAATRPPAGLWDALLAAGGPAAAFALLGRIDRGEDWRRPAAGPSATTGSSWDVAQGPDVAAAHHLGEWVTGSAVHPALAAANVATLQGAPALEALAGDRLEQLGGWAQQYATGPVARLLRPLEPIAAAGGWWCSGLDPLAIETTDRCHLPFTRPMGWGCFKPDRPRIESRDGKVPRARKYEHPIATPARSFWLLVPAAVAQLVADRYRLQLPAEVAADHDGSAGAFWRWWAAEPRLHLLLTEGAKKAAALLSVGVPAVALPGIWNGCPRTGPMDPATGRRTGPMELLADLAGVPLAGRLVWVLFDHSDKAKPAEPIAARALGRLLVRAGARQALTGTVPGTHGKGADDHLANGGTWEQLRKALKPLAAEPVLPCLRRPQKLTEAGSYVAPLPAPSDARLVALSCSMGAGKTVAVGHHLTPFLADGTPALNLTHRTALGQAQSEAWGLPWAAAPGTDERLQGLGLCWDSCCPESRLRIRPSDWSGTDGRGPILLLDEVVQGIEQALFATGTRIADRRVSVLETAAELLRSARQTIACDAQLSDPILQLLETLTGERAYLIGSEHRPMAGRRLICPQGLTVAKATEAFRAQVLELIEADRPFLCWSTAQQGDSDNAPQSLAKLHLQHRPDARVLVIDSEQKEAAAKLAADPDGVAARFDAIYCSPAIASGLSITLRDHFAAVLLLSGGVVGPEHVAQAAARVRDPGCPVYCFAPERAPGNQLQIGSGDTNTAALLRHLSANERHLMGDLVTAGGWDPAATNESPWLRCWLELAAFRNRQRLAYSATVAGLLEREGWELIEAEPITQKQAAAAAVVTAQLQQITAAAVAAQDAATITAELLSNAEAAKLQRRHKLTEDERAQLRRHKVAAAWGLAADAPTLELLEADRQGLSKRARFGWILRDMAGRDLVAIHDARRRQQLSHNGKTWAPDLVRESLSHKVAAAAGLGLRQWLERSDWFAADDPRLLSLQDTATKNAASMRQALGVSPGKRASGTLRALLRLAGFELESKRLKTVGGRDGMAYRVVPIPLPTGADPERLQQAWRNQLAGTMGSFSPIEERGDSAHEGPPDQQAPSNGWQQ